jgi:hypothetical protein
VTALRFEADYSGMIHFTTAKCVVEVEVVEDKVVEVPDNSTSASAKNSTDDKSDDAASKDGDKADEKDEKKDGAEKTEKDEDKKSDAEAEKDEKKGEDKEGDKDKAAEGEGNVLWEGEGSRWLMRLHS